MGRPATSLAAASVGSSETFTVYANAAAASGVNTSEMRALWLPTGGTLIVTLIKGGSVTIPDAGTSVFLPIQFAAITGGTATNFMILE